MRSRRRLLIVVAAGIVAGVAALLAAVMHFAQPQQPAGQAVNADTASLFAASFADSQGKLQPLSQWRQQVLVVNFWASWCPPCRDEMPELSALHEKYRDRGLSVLGISTEDAAKMQQFARELPVSYPLLAADFDGMTLATALGNDRDALPYTLVLRRDGSIAASYVGRIDSQVLEQALLPLL